MSPVLFEQRFQRGDASADEIQAVVDEVLAQIAIPGSEAAHAAEAAGLPAADLVDAAADIREGEQGAEPILTTIVVSIAVSAGSKVADTLWTDVIWPRLRRRAGARALGPASPATGTTKPHQVIPVPAEPLTTGQSDTRS
jgi:hypothetical protein